MSWGLWLSRREQRIQSSACVRRGYRWMIPKLYHFHHYRERLVRAMRSFRPSSFAARPSARLLSWAKIAITVRIHSYFLFTRDRVRRRFFVQTLWKLLREHPSMQKFVVTLSFMTVHTHFHRYVNRTHGDAETTGRRSPFAGYGRVVHKVPVASRLQDRLAARAMASV